MTVVQINCVSGIYSTGRNTIELDHILKKNGISSYIACSSISSKQQHDIIVGTPIDMKIHALCSRITGLQGYFSFGATRDLLGYLDRINPDIIILGVLHTNFINIPMLFRYIVRKKIALVIVLHDLWLATGHCFHPTQSRCEKYREICYQCAQRKEANISWFFDRSKKVQNDRKKLIEQMEYVSVVGVSEWVTQCARKASVFKSCKSFTTIYNWIDQQVFHPYISQKCEKYGIPINKTIILGVAAKWSEEKGIADFIELSQYCKEEIIVLLGEMGESIKLPKNIISIPFITGIDELANLYSSADVFVSLSRQETFGKVIAEALACGTPTVVYNVTACGELVGKNCGYVEELYDVQGVYRSIQKIKRQGKHFYSSFCQKHAEEQFEYLKNTQTYISLLQNIEKKRKEKII